MFDHYAALYARSQDFEHARSFSEPVILASGLDSAVVHEDGAYLVMRDVSIQYHRDGVTPSHISGVIRGTYLNPSRALERLNEEVIHHG